jgi:hypothetical protein
MYYLALPTTRITRFAHLDLYLYPMSIPRTPVMLIMTRLHTMIDLHVQHEHNTGTRFTLVNRHVWDGPTFLCTSWPAMTLPANPGHVYSRIRSLAPMVRSDTK